MKSLLVVGCLCLVAATVRAESEEVERFIELAKEHAASCSKELGVSEDEWSKIRDPSVEGDDSKTACMHACIMQRLGMMESTEDAVTFNLDKIKEVVEKVAAPDAVTAQTKVAMDCMEEVKGKNELCGAAMAFSHCYAMKTKPE